MQFFDAVATHVPARLALPACSGPTLKGLRRLATAVQIHARADVDFQFEPFSRLVDKVASDTVFDPSQIPGGPCQVWWKCEWTRGEDNRPRNDSVTCVATSTSEMEMCAQVRRLLSAA